MSHNQGKNLSLFQFEADFVQDLRCIPMQVRMKLDTCGVKLKLTHWHQLTVEEREELMALPCETLEEQQTYREQLRELVFAKTGGFPKDLAIDPDRPWMDATVIPTVVVEKAESVTVNLTLEQWSKLTPAQRFALIKLSRPSHENHNFVPALREFQILP
ncbi:MAG: nitrate reductase associated protein [Roseofilum sp. SBFL]|uniref:nitrate reductase associated protein n=1 Tax=unclassified Roseofilum TaxID=2620099 RepID=UPI001B188F5C|nr:MULTISPECIES: nitrate reductase associated protein [unclassified Roseofilum]MBP0013035.1 nitrate reductase associated protein [Roseofilum sp. SID3]MBP0025059.1 nitrate reductase associated protein [Roseofilum sp. SID2]MBP0037923.1 nitrate reductase associated protein [Roseofilum sp. SID1]MBP0043428.1 nitrate reductase associated protein [Roseofilum sp. SBFL]